MKILLTFFVLLFSSSVIAKDISNFQIEGMSIGDSLLDFYSDREIENNLVDLYSYKKDKTFIQTGFDVFEHGVFLVHGNLFDKFYVSFFVVYVATK